MTSKNIYKSKEILIGVVTVLFLCVLAPVSAFGQNSAPTIEKEDFSLVSDTSVNLIATINPNGQYTYVRFEYGTTTSFGSSIDSNVGSGTSGLTMSVFAGGLKPNTAYYYRVKAWSTSGGITNGQTVSFFTNLQNPNPNPGSNYNQTYSGAPLVYTQAPSLISYNSASLNANINPENNSTNYWFEYGTSTYLGNTTGTQYLGNGSYAINASNYAYGLQPNTTYYYKAVASNNLGTSSGGVMSFTTSYSGNSGQQSSSAGAPTLITNPASSILSDSATLNGSVNPNNAFTNYWFEYGTTTSLGQVGGFQSLPASGNSSNALLVVSGLIPNTTYYYRIAAKNDYALTKYGDILSFVTGNNQVTGSSQASGNKNVITTVSNKLFFSKKTVVNLSSGTDSISPVSLETDTLKPSPGEEFNYTVSYTNVSGSKISQANLRIILPSEVDYVSSSLPATTISGKMLMFDLGGIGSNSKVFVTTRVKVSDTAKPGSNLIFTVVLEYVDSLGLSQSVSSYLTVQVGEKNQNLSGSLAGLISGLGDRFLLLVWLALGTFIVWLICYIVYRKYFKNGNGSLKAVAYRPPPTAQ